MFLSCFLSVFSGLPSFKVRRHLRMGWHSYATVPIGPIRWLWKDQSVGIRQWRAIFLWTQIFSCHPPVQTYSATLLTVQENWSKHLTYGILEGVLRPTRPGSPRFACSPSSGHLRQTIFPCLGFCAFPHFLEYLNNSNLLTPVSTGKSRLKETSLNLFTKTRLYSPFSSTQHSTCQWGLLEKFFTG